MAWQVRAMAALPDDLGSSLSTYKMPHSICTSDSRGSDAFIWSPHVVQR